jgi:hypothetical protein
MNTPIRISRKETRDTSNDKTWTISVVPTLAAQHDGQRRHKVDKTIGGECRDHQSCSRAALKYRGYSQPSQEGFETVAKRIAKHAPKLWAESAHDPGLDHVHAPNEECDRSGEIYEGQSCVHPGASVSESNLPVPGRGWLSTNIRNRA